MMRRILMLVTEPARNLVAIVKAAVDGGVDIVQYRDRHSTDNERLEIAMQLRDATRGRALLVINASAQLAADVDADGVHLPERGVSVSEARHILGEGKSIGRSVHSVEAARLAMVEGADYLIAGTIFKSSSHPDTPAAGTDFLRSVCTAGVAPVIAIGGIEPSTVEACVRAGARGIAVLSRVMRSNDPAQAAHSFRRLLDSFEGVDHD